MPIVAKKKTPAPGTKASAPETDSFMSKMKGTQAAEGFTGGPPPGQYEALASASGLYEDPTSEKESFWIEFIVVNDEKYDGKKARTWYTLKTAEGADGSGWEYLKRDLSMLGFDDSECNSKEDYIESADKHCKENLPWVMISVVKKNGFINTFLNSVMEDQDQAPELPES